VVARAEELTVDQVLPALPPMGIAGSVEAIHLVDDDLKQYLLNPDLVLKPRSEWLTELKRSRMFPEITKPPVVPRFEFTPLVPPFESDFWPAQR